MLAKFSAVESERTVSKLRKRIRKFCVGFTHSIKQARVIRKFHVAVVQLAKAKKCTIQNSEMHVQSCCFAIIYNPIAFFRSRCRRSGRYLNSLLLGFKKFWYYGNVTSQFSTLLYDSVWRKTIRTIRSESRDGSENVAEKVNSRSFNLHRDYSKSLTFPNVGEPS